MSFTKLILLIIFLCVQNSKDNPPCNTLFIGNLGENIIEEELRGLFSVYESLPSKAIISSSCYTMKDAAQSIFLIIFWMQTHSSRNAISYLLDSQ